MKIVILEAVRERVSRALCADEGSVSRSPLPSAVEGELSSVLADARLVHSFV